MKTYSYRFETGGTVTASHQEMSFPYRPVPGNPGAGVSHGHIINGGAPCRVIICPQGRVFAIGWRT